MAQHKCTVDGCTRTFPKAQGLATHMRRAHSLNMDGTPHKAGESVTPKAVKKAPAKVKTEVVVLPHCPHCGYSLAAHAHAYAAVKSMA